MSRSPARSNAITSVGSTATQALIVGSPVKTAMSPMNVRLSASRDVDVLAGLAVDELDEPALDHVERRVADGVLVEHLAGLERAPLALLGEPRQLAVREPREQHLVVEVGEPLAAHHLRRPSARPPRLQSEQVGERARGCPTRCG